MIAAPADPPSSTPPPAPHGAVWCAPGGGRLRRTAAVLGACIALAAAALGSVALGPAEVPIRPAQVAAALAGHVPVLRTLAPPSTDADIDVIVWEVRLPRVLTAALVGMLLGCAGVALQGLLMNPLADPYTVGVSAGAAVGAAIAEVAGISALLFGLGGVATAFAGALLAMALVYSLARVGGRVSVQTFLLAGVVVGTMLWSLIPLLMTITGRAEDLQRIYFYLIGSLQGADWTRFRLLLPFAVVSAGVLLVSARELNLMTFGEETAAHLGVDAERFKRRVLLTGSLATAAAVSVGGIIGFVGLVVPHVARRLVGPDHRTLIPLSGLLGALLMIGGDTLVRVWLNEMPVGVVTSVVGAPVFCLLLRRRRATAW